MSNSYLNMDVIMEELKTALAKQQNSFSNYVQALCRQIGRMGEDIKNLTQQFGELRDTENYDSFLLLIKSLSAQHKINFPDTLYHSYCGHQGSFCIDFVDVWISCCQERLNPFESHMKGCKICPQTYTK